MAEKPAVTKLRDILLVQGPVSFKTLSKKFFALDTDGNWQLTKEELKKSLFEVVFSDSDLDEIFDAFDKKDKDGKSDGKINHIEFINGIMPPMSKEREAMVKLAFKQADKTGDRIITIADMRGIFKPNTDPGYKAGTKSEDQVFEDFLKEFDEADTPDGKVTETEFKTYYAVKGKDITCDEDFQKLLKDTWKLC